MNSLQVIFPDLTNCQPLTKNALFLTLSGNSQHFTAKMTYTAD
jgi:hypothetical protein